MKIDYETFVYYQKDSVIENIYKKYSDVKIINVETLPKDVYEQEFRVWFTREEII